MPKHAFIFCFAVGLSLTDKAFCLPIYSIAIVQIVFPEMVFENAIRSNHCIGVRREITNVCIPVFCQAVDWNISRSRTIYSWCRVKEKAKYLFQLLIVCFKRQNLILKNIIYCHDFSPINDNLEAQLSGVYHRFFDASGNSDPGLISDLGEVVGGATPSTGNPEYFCDDGIAWISPKDLTGTGLKFIYRGELCITESAYNSCSTKLMPAGTVLFTSRAPVGTVAIAMNDICTNQGFKSVIPKKEIGTAFVYYFLKENKQLIESHASGTTFMEVSGNVLKSIPAIVPKPEVASRFAAICMPLFEEQRQNELEIGRLQELRQTLISSISSR